MKHFSEVVLSIIWVTAALLVAAGAYGYANSKIGSDPDWNVMDWPHVGRTDLGFSMFVDKRSTAAGDSTAYLIYQIDPQRFTAVRIEANVGGECWSAESDGNRLIWTRNDDEFIPCQMYDVLEYAFDEKIRAE